jgi:ribosomal-protein-alanine N-acetyltransferase
MTVVDVPAVAALEKMAFSLPWSRYAFEHEVQHNPMAHFLVLQRCDGATRWLAGCATLPSGSGGDPSAEPAGSGLLGYAGFWLIIDEAHICTLAVHPDWRRRGLGELLLVHLIERAAQVNAASLTLEVRTSNLTAQNLYSKYGFVRVGRRRAYYTDTGEDAIIMSTDRISSATFQGRFRRLRGVLLERLAEAESSSSETEHHSPHERQHERSAC